MPYEPDPTVPRDTALFQSLPPDAAEALLAEAEWVRASAGETVVQDGDAECVCLWVRSGALRAVELGTEGVPEAVVREIGPGEVVDELQVLAGVSRPVVVRVAEDAELAKVPVSTMDRLARDFPALEAARARLHRRQLLCRLYPVFGPLDAEFLDELEEMAEWVHLPRGRLLFEQANPAQGLYLVLSGRVQIASHGRDGRVHVLGEAGRGETVGELAFFGERERRERVVAVRDSVLVGFTQDEFDRLVTRRPGTLRWVTRALVERLHRAPVSAAGGRVASIAVVAASPGAPVDAFCARLVAQLSAFGSTLLLDADAVERLMEEPGIAQAWDDGGETARLLAWLEAREAAHRFVVYRAEARPTAWTRRCLRQADRVVLLARADEDPVPTEVERALLATEGKVTDAHEVLVLLHQSDALPTGTRRWLQARSVDEHHHLRWHREGDIARLARVFAGRTVGLVFGGGGARGFAHIGVLRALAEAGIPVDVIGGTSMGASIAAQHALGWSPEEIAAMNRRVWIELRPHKRLSIPLLSVVSNRDSTRCGEMMYGTTEIEDLWTPFFCVSSDLTSAEMVVHRTGSLLWAATASASIPGFALPVLENGHLLVDGAVLNNVPTDVMRSLGAGTVIASEVSVEEDASFTCSRIPSPWNVLRDRMLRRPPAEPFPSLLEMVLRASMLHSIYREKTAVREADFSFRPAIERFGLMEFDRLDEIVDAGYEHGREVLAKWPGPGLPVAPADASSAASTASTRDGGSPPSSSSASDAPAVVPAVPSA